MCPIEHARHCFLEKRTTMRECCFSNVDKIQYNV